MKHHTKRKSGWARILPALLVAATVVFPGATSAQTYPDHPIKLIAPFGTGGALDFIARGVAQRLNVQMGQPVIVENRPGAAGIIGSQFVMRSPADGYTLLLGATTTHGINPTLYKPAPYDALKDFAPVSLVATIPHVLIVNAALPVKNLQEFIKYAKAHPGLAYGSAGVGSPHHLAGEMLRSMTGIDVIHAPYKGSGPAMSDVMGNQIAFMSIEYTAAATNIKGGKLRAIAVASDHRIPGLDVPTFAEQGVPNFEVTAWYAIFAPAKTPTAVTQRLSREIATGLTNTQFRDSLIALGAKPIGSTPEQLAAFVAKDVDLWAKVIKSSGATAE
jgi:tripartite-type tricarboxylate transporter receptor subunit TctC